VRAEQIFGKPLDAHIEQDHSQLDFRRVFVSRQEIVGKRIRELNLENTMGATVTRLRRGDVNFVPTRDTRLELGDRIRVLTRRENFSPNLTYAAVYPVAMIAKIILAQLLI